MPPPKAPHFPIAPVLEELGGDQVPRVRGTGYAKMRCPFHGPDKTPSASVSQYGFRCFTCGKSGDAISLIREEEECSFADAVERCEQITGMKGGHDGKRQETKSLLDI